MVEFLRMFHLPAPFRAAAYRRRRFFPPTPSLFHSSRGLLTPPRVSLQLTNCDGAH